MSRRQENKERGAYRLTALVELIRGRLGEDNDSELARRINISIPAMQRIKERRSSALQGKNQEGLCSFLQVSPKELESYLQGEIGIETIARNVPLSWENEQETLSKKAYQTFIKDILPRLTFEDFEELWRIVQERYLAWTSDLKHAKRYKTTEIDREAEESGLTISSLLKEKDLTLLADNSGIDLDRLIAIANGAEPSYREICALEAGLGIPAEELEKIRSQQFKTPPSSNGDDRRPRTNGTTAN